MSESYKPAAENFDSAESSREKLIQELIDEVKQTERDHFDIIHNSIEPKIQTLLEAGQVEVQVTTPAGKKEWLRPNKDPDGRWSVIDSSEKEHLVSTYGIALYIAGSSTHNGHRFAEGAIDEELEREMLRLILEAEHASQDGVKPDVEPVTIFCVTHSPRTETRTGFELDEFLAQSQGFDSQTEKIESLALRLFEQVKIISALVGVVEKQVAVGEAPETIVQKLKQNPVWLKLSREQKFALKSGVFLLEKSFHLIQRFFTDFGNWPPEHQAILLTGCQITADYVFKGGVHFKETGYFVEIHVDSAEDYDFLFLGQKAQSDYVNDSVAFKVDSSYGFPVIVVPHEFRRPEKSKSGEVVYKTIPVAEAIWEKNRQHEMQHARNSFLMPSEDTYELRRAKDEIIAYLRNGWSLGTIESIIVTGFNKSYTYDLNGQELEEHKSWVGFFIKSLADAVSTDAVNLDVLAVTPMRLWKYVGKKMGQFVREKDEAVVPYQRGALFAEKQQFTRELIVKANADFVGNNPMTLTGFLRRFKAEFARPELVVDTFLIAVLRKNFLSDIERYIANDQALSLYGDLDEVADIGRAFALGVDMEKIESAFLDMADMGGDMDQHVYQKNIERAARLDRVKYAYFAKVFSELLGIDDERLQAYGQQLAASGDTEITIDGLWLNSLEKKILFARQKLEEYRGRTEEVK